MINPQKMLSLIQGFIVKDLSEYNESTSEQELFYFLYDKIIAKEYTAFSALKAFVQPIIRDTRIHPVMMRCFELVKRLNWGFFSEMSLQSHKRLWRELVIPDQTFPEAGDLKDTLQISNLYIAMLDIHGYTKFCMDSRKNLSMMHTLDWAMNTEVRRISTYCQAVSQRERGDEMVVVAASATDVLTVTLAIMDYFGKTNYVNDPNIPTRRQGNAEALPVFKCSAGITGGNTQSPLIITEKGNLAGFLLNSGARLQTRANELSSKESRIMVAKQVQMNFMKENQTTKCSLIKNKVVYFFDTGHIEFKGVMIPTCEVVFKEDERYKEQFSEELVRLFGSIRESLWEQRIYLDLIDLLSKVASAMPRFSITPKKPIHGMTSITNDSFMQLCRLALKAYSQDEDYATAVAFLKEFIDIIDQIPSYDRLILDYLRGAADKYDMLLKSYEAAIDREIEDRAIQIYQGQYLKAYQAAKNAATVYQKLLVMGRKSPEITKKKALWFNLIKANKDKMEFTLYSGKK
jgi:tetratricopeptide (TPR) repeat protein